ncbi:MAG: DEAD/DEAH box helicase [Bacilli bacterium]|jgi:ATP-dependent RNA helicase CshB
MDNNEGLLPIGSINIQKGLQDLLKSFGFTSLSPIQAKACPPLIKGKSVLGLAPTGTGKTLAYLIPILNDLKNDGHVQAVILSPTVALLDQVKEITVNFLKAMGYPEDSVKLIGSNADFSRAKPDIILTTPSLYGRLLSHYPFNELKRVIIDEGDMIAFDGFKDSLIDLMPAKKKAQISFFSASLNVQDIKKVKSTFNIQEIVDVRDSITSKNVNHHLVNIRGLNKEEALVYFLKETHPFKALLFTSTKDELFHLKDSLKEQGVKFLTLFGDMEKRDIKRAMDDFKLDENPYLLATDYASRGLDIPNVKSVISIDLPMDLDYYFHRAGRAGRFNETGDSYVFYTEDDEKQVQSIIDLTRRGVKFDQYILSKNGLKLTKGSYQFKNLGKKDQSNDILQKQIRNTIRKNTTYKIKPNYKKNVRKAVEKVKFRHRQKVVLTNIARAGGDVRDFHMDKNFKRGKKK